MTRHVVEYDIHHRRARSLFTCHEKGRNNKENLSRVPVKAHQSWHCLFRNYEAQVIADIINETWLDPRYKFVVVER